MQHANNTLVIQDSKVDDVRRNWQRSHRMAQLTALPLDHGAVGKLLQRLQGIKNACHYSRAFCADSRAM
jgi:hypothetical protein